MEHKSPATFNTDHHETHGGGTKEVIKITVILSVLTIIELILGYLMINMAEGSTARLSTKIVIILLMLAKAYYIVAYFMHLKHELKNMIMTIVVPLLLFVWFIIAFLYDGNAYKNLRNKYDKHHSEQSSVKAPAASHGSEKPHH